MKKNDLKRFLPVHLKMSLLASIMLAIFLGSCGPTIPIKFSQYPQGTGTKLRQLLKGKPNVGVIAIKPNKTWLQAIGFREDWSSTVEAAVSTAVTDFGYFTEVDISQRKKRLQELAHSQSGLTRESMKLGKALQVSNLLVIKMTNQPKSECNSKMIADKVGFASAMALRQFNGGKGPMPQLMKRTGIRFVTVFVQGRIISTTTGQALTYANNKPYEHYDTIGARGCPSVLVAFSKALNAAAATVVGKLSPKVVTLNVPIFDDVDDTDENKQEQVEKLLVQGNKWAANSELERAAKDWKKALNKSGRTSGSAMWNLGVYNWYKGKYPAASKFFEKVKDARGPDGMSSSMVKMLKKFKAAKNEKKGK